MHTNQHLEEGEFLAYSVEEWTRNTKECALICVDEITDAIDWHEHEVPNKEYEYWQEVKKELIGNV